MKTCQLKHLFFRSFGWSLGAGVDHQPRLLGYHSVKDGQGHLSTPVQKFCKQMDWLLSRGYRILTLKEWWRTELSPGGSSPRSVVLTFDDGFQDIASTAAPELAKRGLAGTVFLSTDHVGKTNAYDRALGVPELPLLSWEEIQQLQKRGWDFQSHGRRHRPLTSLTPEELKDEVAGSKAILEERLGESVDFFCYPYGDFDSRTLAMVTQSGYRGAVSSWAGTLSEGKESDPYRLRRVMADGLHSMGDFAFRFSPAYRRLTDLWFWQKQVKGSLLDA